MFSYWYIIFPLWLLFFPLSIYWISEKIALCGVYHKVDSLGFRRNKSEDKIKEEYLIDKFFMILAANMYLSLPFIISYYIVIDSTLGKNNAIASKEVAFLAFVLTLVSLITIRFLANPPDFLSSRIPSLYPPEKKDEVQSILNERIISFFHSFVCAALIILGILLSANITLDSSIFIKNPEMSFLFFGEIVIIYSLGLMVLTFLLEILLYYFPPTTQISKK